MNNIRDPEEFFNSIFASFGINKVTAKYLTLNNIMDACIFGKRYSYGGNLDSVDENKYKQLVNRFVNDCIMYGKTLEEIKKSVKFVLLEKNSSESNKEGGIEEINSIFNQTLERPSQMKRIQSSQIKRFASKKYGKKLQLKLKEGNNPYLNNLEYIYRLKLANVTDGDFSNKLSRNQSFGFTPNQFKRMGQFVSHAEEHKNKGKYHWQKDLLKEVSKCFYEILNSKNVKAQTLLDEIFKVINGTKEREKREEYYETYRKVYEIFEAVAKNKGGISDVDNSGQFLTTEMKHPCYKCSFPEIGEYLTTSTERFMWALSGRIGSEEAKHIANIMNAGPDKKISPDDLNDIDESTRYMRGETSLILFMDILLKEEYSYFTLNHLIEAARRLIEVYPPESGEQDLVSGIEAEIRKYMKESESANVSNLKPHKTEVEDPCYTASFDEIGEYLTITGEEFMEELHKSVGNVDAKYIAMLMYEAPDKKISPNDIATLKALEKSKERDVSLEFFTKILPKKEYSDYFNLTHLFEAAKLVSWPVVTSITKLVKKYRKPS